MVKENLNLEVKTIHEALGRLKSQDSRNAMITNNQLKSTNHLVSSKSMLISRERKKNEERNGNLKTYLQ